MKNRPYNICLAGHTHRTQLCECRQKSVLKDSDEGRAIQERTAKKPKSHGFKKRDGVVGVRQGHRTFGDSESPAAGEAR